MARALPARIGRLGRMLQAIRRRHSRFRTEDELVAFRRAVTADVEDDMRTADPERADAVGHAAGALEDAIDEGFRRVYG